MDSCQITIVEAAWMRGIILGHVVMSLPDFENEKSRLAKSLIQWASESVRVPDLHSRNLINLC